MGSNDNAHRLTILTTCAVEGHVVSTGQSVNDSFQTGHPHPLGSGAGPFSFTQNTQTAASTGPGWMYHPGSS